MVTIDPDERARLEQLARSVKDAKTAIRVRVILALVDGYQAGEVAKLFLLDEDTVIKWHNKFRGRRFFSDWFAANTNGYSGRLTSGQEQTIEQFVSGEMVIDAKQVVGFIKDAYGVGYTIDGATKLLHRLGFVYKQTTLIPGKLDEQA